MLNLKKINVLACVQNLYVGIVYATFQILITTICQNLGANEEVMALMVSILFYGSAVMSLLMGELTGRFGDRKMLSLSLAEIAAGSVLIVCFKSIIPALIGTALCGIGIGGSQTSIFSVAEKANPETSDKVLSVVMAMYGIGGFVVPIIIENTMEENSYVPQFAIVFIMGLIITAVTFCCKEIDTFESPDTEKNKGVAVFIALRNPVLLISCAGLLLFVALESSLTYWCVDVFEAFGNSSFGSYAVSAYWLASLVGGILGGIIGNDRFVPLRLIIEGTAVAGMIFISNMWIKVILMFLAGVLGGPCYSALTYMGGHGCSENAAAGYAVMTFGACLGGAFVQPVLARIASSLGMSKIYFASIVIALVCAGTAFIAVKKSKEV